MIALVLLLLMLAKQGIASFSFEFESFQDAEEMIRVEANTSIHEGAIQLTKVDGETLSNYGRASYKNAVRLWDPQTQRTADFLTRFTFSTRNISGPPADGMTFFLAPFGPDVAPNSIGEYLGLINKDTLENGSFVAVEFDMVQNGPEPAYSHVGIDINTVRSETTSKWAGSYNLRKATSWVRYDSATSNLTVSLTYDQNPVFSERYYVLSYQVDLRKHLPEKIRVGFTASTGGSSQTHTVHSWSFNSSMDLTQNSTGSRALPNRSSHGNGDSGLAIGLGIGVGAVVCGVVICLWFVFLRKTKGNEDKLDQEMDEEFEKGAGPKKFAYVELKDATNDFSEERKLGEGGFGVVYKGFLPSGLVVAVKKISKTSTQGQKEYVAEVKVISRLSHQNLVQLIGWCHGQSEFLLVYEYLPNGSLDSHLFPGGKFPTLLSWETRHEIAMGLVSALQYLHKGLGQCVIHRDIKSSNIMLDDNFIAKLGDFGLARLVDHEFSLNTDVAGTKGYIAPECHVTGKSSKQSDVYSFGVVALEICCGRKSVLRDEIDESRVSLVNWVWELYGRGQLLEAVDESLSPEFEGGQIERLMEVGLWCCHTDPGFRPAMEEVFNVLRFETPLPINLPRELPMPTNRVFSYPSTAMGSSRTVTS